MSIIDGIKSEIIEKISAGYKEAVSNGSLPETDENIDISSLAKLEVPKDKSHGDFCLQHSHGFGKTAQNRA